MKKSDRSVSLSPAAGRSIIPRCVVRALVCTKHMLYCSEDVDVCLVNM